LRRRIDETIRSVSTDGDDKGPSEFDRMSLNSLKRELEVQKSKTEVARDEAQQRIKESHKRGGAPWGTILGITFGSLVLVGGGLYLARASLPRSYLPAFALPDLPDSGTWEPPVHVEIDAGPIEEDVRRPHRPTKRPQDGVQKQLDFGGETSDPIDGI
jgi:hypothetical protein